MVSMFTFSTSSAGARTSLLVAGLLAVLTACAPATPPAPTPAPKTEAKPTAATTAPSPAAASPAPAAASPAASPAAAPAAATSPTPASSPAAASSPVGSPAAVAPAPTLAPPPVVGASSAAGRVTAFHTLPDTPIAAFQNAKLPGSVPNDRKMLLGGIGSDLWHGPGDGADEFWMVTDRGPNGQVLVEALQRRTFPIPEFAPAIVKVRAAGGTVTVLETIPILGQSGKPVTGLSNLKGKTSRRTTTRPRRCFRTT